MPKVGQLRVTQDAHIASHKALSPMLRCDINLYFF